MLSLHIITCEKPLDGNSKFIVPQWARLPSIGVALHVIDDGRTVDTLSLDGGFKYYMFGRFPKCPDKDGKPMRLKHEDLSRQHAVIVHGDQESLYVIDLESVHGTFVGREKLQPYTPYLLNNANIISFGNWDKKLVVRIYPKGDQILDSSAVSISRRLLAGMSVTCDEDEEMVPGDMETRIHTNLNCMVTFPPPKREMEKRHQSFSLSDSTRLGDYKRNVLPEIFTNDIQTAPSNQLEYKHPVSDIKRQHSSPISGERHTGNLEAPAELLRARSNSLAELFSRSVSPPLQSSLKRDARRKSVIMGNRKVSFSEKCPEFIPRHFTSRTQRKESTSSSSEDEDATTFDPKTDLDENDSMDRSAEVGFSKLHIIPDRIEDKPGNEFLQDLETNRVDRSDGGAWQKRQSRNKSSQTAEQ